MIFKYFDGSNLLHYSFNEDLLGFSCKRCGGQTLRGDDNFCGDGGHQLFNIGRIKTQTLYKLSMNLWHLVTRITRE